MVVWGGCCTEGAGEGVLGGGWDTAAAEVCEVDEPAVAGGPPFVGWCSACWFRTVTESLFYCVPQAYACAACCGMLCRS